MAHLFISYRREDSSGYVGWLRKTLDEAMTDAAVLVDVAAISPGEDYRHWIEEKLGSTSAVLAVIGPDWLDAGDDAGRRRLEDPDDLLRQELEAAFALGRPVFPLLVRRASMPAAEALPDSLRQLARLQAVELRDGSFEQDVGRLVATLRREVEELARDAVGVSGSLTNDGWLVYFRFRDAADHPLQEIFYRTEEMDDFRSTGMIAQHGDPRTVGPIADPAVRLRLRRGVYPIEVKYRNAEGRMRGPVEVVFDTDEQAVLSVKHILRTTTGWVAFREWNDGLLVYFSNLLSHRYGLRRIEYSVDDESLSESLPFRPCEDYAVSPGIGPDDDLDLELPADTRFVAVRVTYLDGEQSETRIFNKDDYMV